MSDPSGPAELLRTPLHAEHAALGARRSPFAGYDMPVFYGSIYDEASAVRRSCGVFDVSHMARLDFPAPTESALQRILTCDLSRILPGAGAYGLVLNDGGGILDDIIVYRKNPGGFLLVVNASNHRKILDWIESHGIHPADRTSSTAMLAVQGPNAESILAGQIPACRNLRYFDCGSQVWPGIGEIWISRTGYTGEDGFELVVPADSAEKIWKWLLNIAKVVPCGLGARDVLRIEAGYSLYGMDMDASVAPPECGLGFAVAEGIDFIGASALRERPARTRMIGLDAGESPASVLRHGFLLSSGTDPAGRVTSGVYSRFLSRSIGFAAIPVDLPADRSLQVEIRGRKIDVRRVSRRFVKDRVKPRRPGG